MSDVKTVPVSLRQDADYSWKIIFDDTEVGEITLSGDDLKHEVFFTVKEPYRCRHYASNALYRFDELAHDTLGISVIHAVVPAENEQARHVVEHSGYQIISRDEENIFYMHEKAVTVNDRGLVLQDGEESIYLAGGCFWGMERVFKVLEGVKSTCTGYANGTLENPSYEDIIRNETGYKETVRVIFDENLISLETVLKAYFMCIDPSLINRQAEDYGTQYQTGVYYKDPLQKERIEAFFEEEKKKYSEFHVELRPLECFYEAEEYHQDYLTKNPNGYCHITFVDIQKVKELNRRG